MQKTDIQSSQRSVPRPDCNLDSLQLEHKEAVALHIFTSLVEPWETGRRHKHACTVALFNERLKTQTSEAGTAARKVICEVAFSERGYAMTMSYTPSIVMSQ